MNFKNDIISKFWFLSLFFVVVLSSCNKDEGELTLYDKGELTATASATDINEGESVTFQSTATKVQTLVWTFEGGSPGSSTSENVTVTYGTGGTYEAFLNLNF